MSKKKTHTHKRKWVCQSATCVTIYAVAKCDVCKELLSLVWTTSFIGICWPGGPGTGKCGEPEKKLLARGVWQHQFWQRAFFLFCKMRPILNVLTKPRSWSTSHSLILISLISKAFDTNLNASTTLRALRELPVKEIRHAQGEKESKFCQKTAILSSSRLEKMASSSCQNFSFISNFPCNTPYNTVHFFLSAPFLQSSTFNFSHLF